MSKPTEARGAAKVAVLMTSLSNLVVIRVVVLKVLPLQFARHTSAFSRVADQHVVRLDDADGVRSIASGSGRHALSVSGGRVRAISNGDNLPLAAVWRRTTGAL